MKDNFDLKKFLAENKTIENSNPFLKEAKEKEEKFNKSKLEKAIKAVLKKEGGAAGLKPLVDAAKDLGAEKKDLMGVLKKMTSVEKHRHGDYILKENARTDAEEEGYLDGIRDEKEDIKSKIREMIINELTNVTPDSEDLGGYNRANTDDIPLRKLPSDDEEEYLGPPMTAEAEEGLEEAKKDDEEEEVETEEESEEEIDTETEETEEEPESEGGIEDIAADMEGDEGDLMDHLISALKVSKAMDNDKLTTQIGNTLKFFVGEYIGGEE